LNDEKTESDNTNNYSKNNSSLVNHQIGLNYKKARWNTEEDELLLYLKNEKKINNWNAISSYFDSKNSKQCMYRYRKIFVKKSVIKFSTEEDQKLISLVEKYGENFQSFLPNFPGKREKDLVHRYYKKLNPSSLLFTQEEDEIILQLYHNREINLNQMNIVLNKNRPKSVNYINLSKGLSNSSIDQISKLNLLKSKTVTAIQKRLEYLLKNSGEDFDKSFNVSSYFSSSMSSNNKSNDTITNTGTGSSNTISLKNEIENDIYVFNHKKYTQNNNESSLLLKQNNIFDKNSSNQLNNLSIQNSNTEWKYNNFLNNHKLNNSLFINRENINNNTFENYNDNFDHCNLENNDDKIILVDENGNEEEYFYRSIKNEKCFQNKNYDSSNYTPFNNYIDRDLFNIKEENKFSKNESNYNNLNNNMNGKSEFEDFEKSFYEIFKCFDNTEDSMIFSDLEKDLNMSFINIGNLTNEVNNQEENQMEVEAGFRNNISIINNNNNNIHFVNENEDLTKLKLNDNILNFLNKDEQICHSKEYNINNLGFRKSKSLFQFSNSDNLYSLNNNIYNDISIPNDNFDHLTNQNLLSQNNKNSCIPIPSHIYNDKTNDYNKKCSLNNLKENTNSKYKSIIQLAEKKKDLKNILNQISEVSSLFCVELKSKINSQYTDNNKKNTFISLLTKIEDFENYYRLKFNNNIIETDIHLNHCSLKKIITNSLSKDFSSVNDNTLSDEDYHKFQKELFLEIDILIKLIKITKLKMKLYKCLYA
jgi:hypothetical protein